LKVIVHDSIGEIARDDWNRLAGDEYPFLRHEFLDLAETTRCVSPETGWRPRHLTIEENGRLRGAMPLYEKSHSFGEFVFDWAWSQAYAQAGLDYFPKLVAAVPFTPAPSTRLLCAEADDTEARDILLRGAIALARESDCSSLHVLFPRDAETAPLEAAGLMLRKDCQFHWHNRGYRDFDDFLATFTSAKRKKAKQDRRRVSAQGIRFRHLLGDQLTEETWSTVYPLIARTFMQRGSAPYFNQAFFVGLSKVLPESLLVVTAETDSGTVGAAVFFRGPETLYGRYWGSDGHYDALHFETCYYQGIEHCIATGKQRFEPGTQGEHKISRGFSPVATWSAHWLAHPEFASAVSRYLGEEARHVERYIDVVESHTPYRNRAETK